MKSRIVQLIDEHKSILIMAHVKPDGDAIGSALALAKGLAKLGKNIRILSKDRIPYDVKFLDDKGFFYDQLDGFKYSLLIALDSSDPGRLEDRKEALIKPLVNIDHHRTNTLYGDVNWVDDTASATGELVYELLVALGVEIDCDIAQDIYVAIASDTGQFMYSNTTSRTHRITSELLNSDIDVAAISRLLYQNVPMNKFQLDMKVLSQGSFHHGERLGIAFVKAEDQKVFNCSNTDNIVETIRNIDTIEVAALLVERDECIKVSMRSKDTFDVSEIAVKYGGGGHPNAAGFGIEGSIDEIRALIIKEFEFLENRDDKCC
jgi:phosphoesterase RecJ-like protein